MKADQTIVKCESIGKKFCRDLKTSLWYGLQDTLSQVTIALSQTRQRPQPALRKGEFWAVRDIDFELKRGDCLGLLGRNGAGKTTLLKLITGLLKPDTGRIEIAGNVGALIALGAGFDPILTGRENIYTYGAILGLSRRHIKSKLDEIISFAGLSDFIDTPVRNYSSGMQIRLGFSVASNLIKPDLLILDEVLSVGDIGFKTKSFNKVTELMRDSAVVFVSHSMQEVSRICNKVALLQNGNLAFYSNDVAKGIEQYNDLFGRDKTSADFIGPARVENVKINSSLHQDAEVVFGSQFKLTFDLKIETSSPKYYIMVQITDRSMRVVAQHFSNDMGKVPPYHNSGSAVTISFTFSDVRLTNGDYYVTLFVIDPKQSSNHEEHIAVYRNVQSFRMVGLPIFVYAPLLLNCTEACIEPALPQPED